MPIVFGTERDGLLRCKERSRGKPGEHSKSDEHGPIIKRIPQSELKILGYRITSDAPPEPPLTFRIDAIATYRAAHILGNLGHLDLLHMLYVDETGMQATPIGKFEIPQGTLDLLVLQIAALGPIHGYAISQRLQQISRAVLQVQQGTLYPALHRLENKGYLRSEWKESETKREAKFYRLTAKGKKQLEEETAKWTRLAEVVGLVLALAQGEPG